VALCQARISTKPLWGFSSSNPYHSQSRAEHYWIRQYQLMYASFLLHIKKIIGSSKHILYSVHCTCTARRLFLRIFAVQEIEPLFSIGFFLL
jgi:hypothetical protein